MSYGTYLFHELATLFNRCQGIKITVEEYDHIVQLLDAAKLNVLYPATMEDRDGYIEDDE